MNKDMNEEYRKVANDVKKVLASRTFPSNEEIYNEIIELEEIWKDILLSTSDGKKIYSDFIDFILYERKNILDARPYLRLRQKDFLNSVNPFIKNKKPSKLYPLRINYTFINWANQRYNGKHKQQLLELEKRIGQLRSDFVTKNFPLILNRIKILMHAYPGIDDISDLINLASQAALNAVDKYAPKYNEATGKEGYDSVLLSTIIGRIRAAFLQMYSSQSVHYYPKDKKKLIEINKLKKVGKTDEEISKELKISEGELTRLFQGFFTTSIDEDMFRIKDETIIPEDSLSEKQQMAKLMEAVSKLSLIEKKILILKGLISWL